MASSESKESPKSSSPDDLLKGLRQLNPSTTSDPKISPNQSSPETSCSPPSPAKKEYSASPPPASATCSSPQSPMADCSEGKMSFPSFLTPQSLADSVKASAIASSLIGSSFDNSGSQLGSMLQGLPLLSALQSLTSAGLPGSLSNLQSLCTPNTGLVCACGVKFNSTTNLEAHKLFYCSHRQGTTDTRTERKEIAPSTDVDEDNSSSSPGSVRQQLKCPQCPYTTSHKLSLNGHMNIHTSLDDHSSGHQASKSCSSASVTSSLFANPSCSSNSSSNAPPVDLRAQERYCSDCDIQFSSLKTFRVHKTHYCQTRHVLKGSKSPPSREELSSGPVVSLGNLSNSQSSVSSQPVLALPTNPVLLLPYSLVAGAQILPPHILPQLGAAFVLPNGQVQPIPSASTSQQLPCNSTGNSAPTPMLSPSIIAAATAALFANNRNEDLMSKASCENSKLASDNIVVLPEANSKKKLDESSSISSNKKRTTGDSPLDLTTKKPKLFVKTDLLSDEEKENRLSTNSMDSSSSYAKSDAERKSSLLSPSSENNLASPGAETSSTKSPRSSSTTPKISSPRTNPDSPIVKPSTSSLAARSPGHVSPGSSGSITNPTNFLPGFPSHLLNNLESLGANFPLASLQCLQSLQNVPPELALKMMNPDILLNGAPPVINPPVIVKQGEAKCEECNIVFYKEESLQIHKKHYCSARESKSSSEQPEKRSPNTIRSEGGSAPTTHVPVRSPIKESLTNVAHASASSKDVPTSKISKPLLQFICSACGIKFSSPDNLSAHQTYYCPKRESNNDETPNNKSGVWRCPRCRVVMSETMQAAHQCVTPAPTTSHGWKCPCCPVLSPTAAAAQKHLETHAGIKAFKCRICGYRGNTLRGMRTHIRMHFEKRTNDLQEENFIACILEDDEPRGRCSSEAQTKQLIDSTRLMLESSFSALLGENGISDGNSDIGPFSCVYCPFVSPVRATLLQHLTLVHKVGLENVLTQELKSLIESQLAQNVGILNRDALSKSKSKSPKESSENGSGSPSSPVSPIKLEPEVKLEIKDNDEDREDKELSSQMEDSSCTTPKLFLTSRNGSSSTSASNGPHYCHVCNMSFAMHDSYVAHRRLYCSRSSSETPPETTVQ